MTGLTEISGKKEKTNDFSQVFGLLKLGTTSVNKEEVMGTLPVFPCVPVTPAPVAFSS